MKDQDDKLAIQEAEQLCRLYMDCKLSVIEETELRYIIFQMDFHSPLIDEVRQIMGIETYISDKSFIKTGFGRKLKFRKRGLYVGIAASVAILFGIVFSLRQFSSPGSVDSQPYYIAYVDGKCLSDDEARSQIEAEKKSVDDFIKEMSEHEAREQQRIDNFFNL